MVWSCIFSIGGYAELSQSLGIDPRARMKRVGLDAAGLAVQGRWISGEAVIQLLELSAGAARREDFGLLLAERRRFSDLGPISLGIREEPDVLSAIELPVRHEHMYNEMLHALLTEASALATLKVSLEPAGAVAARQAVELAVGAFHRVLRNFLGAQWQPLSVCFMHDAPADPTTHRRVFGPVVEFDRVTELARAWGSRLADLGEVGHLNPASGYGEWPGAEELVRELG